jgi:hypothetical protein
MFISFGAGLVWPPQASFPNLDVLEERLDDVPMVLFGG